MIPDDLPDDLNRWPSDPLDLLGVPPDVTPRALRQAYTRLIRRFKPEQHPEHFRRIREAYEFLLARSAVAATFEPPPPPPPPTHRPPPPPPPSPPADHRAALDEAWAWACAGERGRAYARIQELLAAHPDRADLYSRLYWLLTADPDLDGIRAACDWLLAGLHRLGLRDPLLELYSREVVASPWEARSERCRELLDLATDLDELRAVLRWRWQGAGRIADLAQVIAADLEHLAERWARRPEAWPWVLLTAHQFLVWEPPAQALARCRRELGELTRPDPDLADALDEADYLEELARAWRVLREIPGQAPTLALLLPLACNYPLDEARPLLRHWLAQVVADPWAAVQHLDELGRIGSVLLAQLGTLLRQYQAGALLPEDPRPIETLAAGVRDLVQAQGGHLHEQLRHQVLLHCLAESVAPAQVAADLGRTAVPGEPEAQVAAWLARDWPLQLVCLSCRLFWA